MEFAGEQLSLGGNSASVAQEVASHFSMSERHARRYIAAVRDRWRTEGAVNRDERRSQLRAAAEAVYRKAIAMSHWKTCLHTLRFLADLDGVMAPQQLEVQHSTALGDGTITGLKALQERVDALRKASEKDDASNVH